MSSSNPFLDQQQSEDKEENEHDGNYDKNCNNEEENDVMKMSYSEISNLQSVFSPPITENQIPTTSTRKTRPDTLSCDKKKASYPYNLEGQGTVRVDDNNMTHFVAENLEYKIKLASPVTLTRRESSSKQTTPSGYNLLPKQFLLPPHLQQIDSNVLNDIELEAQYLAASVDNLTENLCSLLHSISSITADNVETYKNAVTKLTDTMDMNIKCMYTIMAKAEEISKAIKPAEQLATRIRDIKKLVDMLEGVV